MARFETRTWSNTNPRPFDVVFIDDDNHVYYQPYVTFSSEFLAVCHERTLVAFANLDSVRRLWKRETP